MKIKQVKSSSMQRAELQVGYVYTNNANKKCGSVYFLAREGSGDLMFIDLETGATFGYWSFPENGWVPHPNAELVL